MRSDMAKVVTERPRRGHGDPGKKWGRRLRKSEYDAEDHGPSRAPIARHHQYGWNAKEFSDLLGPLRLYLRKQESVGGRFGWPRTTGQLRANADHAELCHSAGRQRVAQGEVLAAPRIAGAGSRSLHLLAHNP